MCVDKLDETVLACIRDGAPSPDEVREPCERGRAMLADGPDEMALERTRLTGEIAALDERVRNVALQVVDGILTSHDARAVNATPIDRRQATKLRLATPPTQKALPDADRLDPVKFRAAVLRA